MVLVDWYLPGFKAGGPIRSVSNIIHSLKDDFDFWVFTRNTDLGETKPYTGIQADQWVNHPGNYRIYYASKKSLSILKIFSILSNNDFDVLYINGIFSFRFSILPLVCSKFLKKKFKTIVSPRGMFGAGPLSIKKYKKKIYLYFAARSGLFNQVLWHSSSNYESSEIVKVAGQNAFIKQAINIAILPPGNLPVKIKARGKSKLFFLSRIARVKNLSFALEILKEIPAGEIIFDIYGPMEDEKYWNECMATIGTMRKNVQVNYRGVLLPERLHETIRDYHFLFLPTQNENFGHAIVESLAAGAPVIISNCTPWKNLEALKAGWDIPLDQKQKFISVISECVNMNQEEYNQFSMNAFNYSGTIGNKDAVNQNRVLFNSP